MTDFNMQFCRALLSTVMEDVRKYTTVEERKEAWTYHFDLRKGAWEFHGPNGFYWYGDADNAYHARYQGWCAYLASIDVVDYRQPKED